MLWLFFGTFIGSVIILLLFIVFDSQIRIQEWNTCLLAQHNKEIKVKYIDKESVVYVYTKGEKNESK